MALILADRVLETSTSEGLGTFALAGAQTGYQTFSSGIGNGNTCYYTINGQTTEQWEVGIGTVGASTLARTTLISSNTGSFINFVAGVKNVFVTQPASKSIYKDENGNAIPLGSASATQLDITAQGDLRLQDTTGGQYVALQAPSTIATSYTLTMPADDGTAGQALVTDGSGVLSWSSAASGDVYGPASATDNAVARYDGTTGKIIQNSAVTIGDDGATVIDVNSTSAGLRITQIGTGNALLVEDAANPDATPFVIDNSGNAIQGNTTFNTIGSLSIGGFQAQQNSSGAVGTSVISYGTAAAAYARAAFARSPSGVIGTNAAVAINNALMELVAYGHDGTAFIPAASIQANVDGTPGTNDMPGRLVFSTTADGASSPTERMRIDSAGNVGVGTTAQAFEKLVLAGTFPSGSANTRANVVRGTIPSSTTSLFNGFRTEPTTQAASFTLAAMTHFSANQGTLGAGSAVTNQYGFIAESNLTGATNNYGFLGNIPSGTGRWNFYAAGTADNFFGGATTISVNSSSDALRITQTGAGNALLVEDSANPDATPFVIDASGQVIKGYTSTVATGNDAGSSFTPGTQIHAISSQGQTSLGLFNWINSAGNESNLVFSHSKSGVIGTFGAVSSADSLGAIAFAGDDGAAFITAASITSAVDGTPGTNDMPGRLVFSTTADGASSPTERMRIDSAGRVGIGGTPTTGEILALRNTAETTATVFGFRNLPTINQATTTTAYGITDQTQVLSPAALTNLFRFRAAQGSFTGTVTNQYGFAADSGLTGATNNYGFHSNIASATGRYNFYAAGTAANVFVGTTSIGGVIGSESLRVTPVASAVNYLNVQGQITTGGPSLNAAGSDTNIDLLFVTKGTGSSQFYTNSNVLQFLVGHTASAVNYLRVTGGATGTAAIMSAAGTDTNIDIALTPKGTGVLSFGTHTVGILAQSGYITIKDAAGNTRNLLVG